MDSEGKIQQFLLLGKSARGRSCVEIITKATSEPGIFAFGELLELPNVQEVRTVWMPAAIFRLLLNMSSLVLQLRGTDLAQHLTLLELFCYGTFEEYKGTLAEATVPYSDAARFWS
jgi:COP9 signalosome complex subunit 7